MDLKAAWGFRGPFEEAYQQTREAEIVNQQRVAQAQQMLQEARLKAEMQPYDIQSKLADIEYKKAQARKWEAENPSAEDKKKAAMLKQLQIDAATSLPFLENIHSRFNLSKSDEEAAAVAAELEQRLGSMGAVGEMFRGGVKEDGSRGFMLSDELLSKAKQFATDINPELGKNARHAESLDKQMERFGKEMTFRENKLAQEKELAELEAQAKANKNFTGLESAMATYQYKASTAKTAEEKMLYESLYSKAEASKLRVDAARAAANAQAQAQGKVAGTVGTLDAINNYAKGVNKGAPTAPVEGKVGGAGYKVIQTPSVTAPPIVHQPKASSPPDFPSGQTTPNKKGEQFDERAAIMQQELEDAIRTGNTNYETVLRDEMKKRGYVVSDKPRQSTPVVPAAPSKLEPVASANNPVPKAVLKLREEAEAAAKAAGEKEQKLKQKIESDSKSVEDKIYIRSAILDTIKDAEKKLAEIEKNIAKMSPQYRADAYEKYGYYELKDKLQRYRKRYAEETGS